MPRPRTRAGIVEDCLSVEIGDILGIAAPIEALPAGVISWKLSVTGDELGSIAFSVVPDGNYGYSVRLNYSAASPQKLHHSELLIPLTSTRANFMGLRWWFSCPIDVNGQACGARCRTLYLPPGQVIFGCRTCHDLTYESCRASHRYGRRNSKNQRCQTHG